jgi:cytochrome c
MCGLFALYGTVTAQGKSTWTGIFTDAQARRGQTVYDENCALCHGAQLLGGELGPPLCGAAFVEKWNGQRLSEVFDYMRVLMPLHSPGGLSHEQNADILAFMLKRSGFPDGTIELPSKVEALSELRFLARKP